MSTFFNIGLERTVRQVFDNNKENLETLLENLLIPLANGFLNELTLQDLVGAIGDGSDGSDGPHIDPETGDLICPGNDEHTTSEYTPSAETSVDTEQPTMQPTMQPTLYPTVPDETTTEDDKKIESTTLHVPDTDVPNSSNFLFDKFQVFMIFTVTTMSLRIL